jgi:hypothetical protein
MLKQINGGKRGDGNQTKHEEERKHQISDAAAPPILHVKAK